MKRRIFELKVKISVAQAIFLELLRQKKCRLEERKLCFHVISGIFQPIG
jgi:hypothetical protein